MKRYLFFFFLIMALGIGTSFVEAVITDSATNTEFPSQVDVSIEGDNLELEATGVATRKKFFVKVYSVAHYMQNPVKGSLDQVLAEVFDASKAKQLTLKWLRNVDSKTIQKGYHDAFSKILGADELKAKSDQIAKFVGFFDQDAKVDDIHIFRWLPGGIIEIEINGQSKGQIKEDGFAADVWNIWLGPKSVVPRENLVSEIVN
ncbi:MAG: chalcone isomerase family protein [Chlamydiia bacterium]|nr:chalcone isomerase family protein [Chlamydiia bacterium]